MSELQDQFDKGLITAAEFNAHWDEEMEENERLHPGIHSRMHAYLLAEFPGPGVDEDEFLGLKDSTKGAPAEQPIKDNNQNDYSDDCHAATPAPIG